MRNRQTAHKEVNKQFVNYFNWVFSQSFLRINHWQYVLLISLLVHYHGLIYCQTICENNQTEAEWHSNHGVKELPKLKCPHCDTFTIILDRHLRTTQCSDLILHLSSWSWTDVFWTSFWGHTDYIIVLVWKNKLNLSRTK